MGNEVSNPTQPYIHPPLDRLPKENDASYARRTKVYSQIMQYCYPNLSGHRYRYWGQSVDGIDETSIPSPDWNRIQCMYWIKCYLEFRTVLPAHTATPVASHFSGSGHYLIRMEKQDWENLFWGYRAQNEHVWLSLWANMEDIKAKGLIGKESFVEEGLEKKKQENAKEQEENDMWADELLDLSDKEGS